MVEQYRYHNPKIACNPETIRFITELSAAKVPLIIITDGRSVTQRNKLDSLNLSHYFDAVFISEEVEKEKPNIYSFNQVQQLYKAKDYYYIGDNITKDFLSPNSLGWCSICLKDDGRNIHSQENNVNNEYLPQQYIESFKELMIN